MLFSVLVAECDQMTGALVVSLLIISSARSEQVARSIIIHLQGVVCSLVRDMTEVDQDSDSVHLLDKLLTEWTAS
jgi:hypothetical protein